MNDDSDWFDDQDPDINYFSEIISENCQHHTFNTIHDYMEVNSTFLNDNRFLTVFSQNIQSLNANLDYFMSLFIGHDLPDVFVLSETWHDSNTPVIIPGYTGFHTTRQGRRSGGVSVFVKYNFNCSQVMELSYADNSIEICTVKITNEQNSICICGIYRPHSDTITNFGNCLEGILNQIPGPCILTGDFNINLMSDSNDVSLFIDTMRSNYFYQVIQGVTHPGQNNNISTCIDHFWTNDLGGYNCGIIETDVSHHYTTFYQFPFISRKASSNKIKIQFREYNDSCKLLFEEKLSQFDWNLLETDDINLFLQNFTSTVNRFYTECFPLRSKEVTEKYFKNPWHGTSVKKLSDARIRYHSLLKQGLVTKAEYSLYRNRITSLIRKHKESYFQNLFARNISNIRETWKNIKLLCNNNSNKKIESILHNNVKYSSDSDIAEIFNNFFVNIARDIENSLPTTTNSPYSYLNRDNFPEIDIVPVTFDEISSIISSLKNKKTDNAHISVCIFKSFRHHFIPTLCKIINMSLDQGIFPDSLKHATVIPIYKKGCPQNVSHYRPISLLPFMSKIFEKCMLNRLNFHASSCNIFTTSQFGFRKGRSTQDAILALTENIYHAFNRTDGSFCLNVFIDFKKCFDTINHEILLNKLRMYGITGRFLDLIRSYLTGRSQSVRINDCVSSSKNILIGLPQGSLLSANLFLWFANEIPNISNIFKTILYADDTTLSFRFNSVNEANTICNSELAKFHDWSVANKLCISPEANKTYFIVHTYRNIDQNLFDLRINDSRLGCFDEGKFLGLTIDSKMKYQSHINEICAKISKTIGIMFKLFKLKINSRILKQIYYSLIYPYLLYNCVSYSGTFDVHLHRLVILQKRAIRILSGASYLAHTDPLFAMHKILKFEDICRFSVGLYVYDNQDSFNFIDHNYNTRNSSNMRPAQSRLTITQNSIDVTGPNVWNDIPTDIKNSSSREVFKYKFKNYLLSHY